MKLNLILVTLVAAFVFAASNTHAANQHEACRIATGQELNGNANPDHINTLTTGGTWTGNISYVGEDNKITYDAHGRWSGKLWGFRADGRGGVWLNVRIPDVPSGGDSPKGGYSGKTRWISSGNYFVSQHGDVVYWLKGRRLHGVIGDTRGNQCFPMSFVPSG